MFEQIDQIKEKFSADTSAIKNGSDLEEIRVKYLGRKGLISSAFQQVSQIPKEQKPEFGQRLNQLKNYVSYCNLHIYFTHKVIRINTKNVNKKFLRGGLKKMMNDEL